MIAVDMVAGPEAQRTLVFHHGILGRGKNWATIARRLTEARPAWAAALVDLRAHGESADYAEGPDTLDQCARDVEAAVSDVAAVMGHSFGGKVALAVSEVLRVPAFVVDSTPSRRPSPEGSADVLNVISQLRAIEGRHFEHRRDFVKALGERGISQPTAMWLAMNLRDDEAGKRFALPLDRIDALLDDYFERDLWDAAEKAPMHLIVGGRSKTVPAADVERARGLGLQVDVLEDAGHWVHVDAPDALFEKLLVFVDGCDNKP